VSGEPILTAEQLHVWFDLAGGGELHAVQGISFELRPGERMGLVGESGCGKTTAILALMGLLPSSASVGGRVLLEGDDILAKGEETVSPHRWKDIAMVFQGAMNARHGDRPDRAGAGARVAGDGGHLGRPRRPLPARVLGRHAPAGCDRDGTGMPAEGAARG
jgi:hypothetical protein